MIVLTTLFWKFWLVQSRTATLTCFLHTLRVWIYTGEQCAHVGAVEVAVLMSKTELGSRDASQRCHRGMGGLSENVGTPTEIQDFIVNLCQSTKKSSFAGYGYSSFTAKKTGLNYSIQSSSWWMSVPKVCPADPRSHQGGHGLSKVQGQWQSQPILSGRSSWTDQNLGENSGPSGKR